MSSKQSREQALEIQRRVRNAVRGAVSARRIQSSAGPITEKARETLGVDFPDLSLLRLC